jgi:hypothetical protein
MTASPMSPQLDLFEENISRIVEDILSRPQQPSAVELLQLCETLIVSGARENLKEAVLRLIDEKSLPGYKLDYLKHIVEDKSLDRAIAGDDCKEKRDINTGIDLLVANSKAYRHSREFREMIEFIGKFREYSPYNNMLVRVQNPSCGFYATEKDWRERFGRTIKEDARPMLILAPMHPVMLVYELDSTEGKDLPKELVDFSSFKGQWDSRWLERLLENAKRYRINVERKTLSASNSGFATHARKDGHWKMRIVLHDDLDEPSRFGVLCHELAHIFLGHLGGDQDLWWPSRMNLNHRSIEIEAEASAYIVTQQLGLEGASHAYVSRHLKDADSLPEGVSIDNIAKVSGKIHQMTHGLLPEPKPRVMKERKKERSA